MRNDRWTDESGAEVVSGLQQRMGDGVRIELRLVEQIPPEASGKHRYVVSHVPLPAGPNAAATESD